MINNAPRYRWQRFPIEIGSHAVWLYHRFGLSLRDVEDLLAERGIVVTPLIKTATSLTSWFSDADMRVLAGGSSVSC